MSIPPWRLMVGGDSFNNDLKSSVESFLKFAEDAPVVNMEDSEGGDLQVDVAMFPIEDSEEEFDEEALIELAGFLPKSSEIIAAKDLTQ